MYRTLKLIIMKNNKIIKTLITDRENTLSVKSIEVVKNVESLANPRIMVGTLPFYEWDQDKTITYVITYGRYLSCNQLVYDKEIKADKDFIYAKGSDEAKKVLTKILDKIKK